MRPDTIRRSDKINGLYNRGSNSVDGWSNITNMGSNGKEGMFVWRIGASDRRTDQMSNGREGLFDGKEGRFNRNSEGNKGKYGQMSNKAASPSSSGSTLVSSPLKTPTKSPSPSKGGSDGKISNGSNSGMEEGNGLTNRVKPNSNRRSTRVDTLHNRGSNSVDDRSNITNMVCNGKGGRIVLRTGTWQKNGPCV